MDEHIVTRAKSYQTESVDGVDVRVPIGNDIIEDVAARNDIDEDVLWDVLVQQQYDLFNDGTRIGFIGYLLDNELGCVIDYTDEAVYLTVKNEVWRREFSWVDYEENVEDSMLEAHTDEVVLISNLSSKEPDETYHKGYVVGIDFPIRSVDEHDDIYIDPYPIAERAEFLRFEAELGKEKAQVQAMTEAMAIHSTDNEESVAVIADVLGMDVDVVVELQAELKAFRENATEMLQDLAGVDADDSSFATTNVFERVASFK